MYSMYSRYSYFFLLKLNIACSKLSFHKHISKAIKNQIMTILIKSRIPDVFRRHRNLIPNIRGTQIENNSRDACWNNVFQSQWSCEFRGGRIFTFLKQVLVNVHLSSYEIFSSSLRGLNVVIFVKTKWILFGKFPLLLRGCLEGEHCQLSTFKRSTVWGKVIYTFVGKLRGGQCRAALRRGRLTMTGGPQGWSPHCEELTKFKPLKWAVLLFKLLIEGLEIFVLQSSAPCFFMIILPRRYFWCPLHFKALFF